MTNFRTKHMQAYQSSQLHQVIRERDKLREKYETADSWRFIWLSLFIMSIGYIIGRELGGWL
jgi:hypothetical protein